MKRYLFHSSLLILLLELFVIKGAVSQLLTPPVLVSPVNASAGQPTSLILSWNSVSGSNGYQLQLSKNSIFDVLIVNDTLIVDTAKQLALLANNTSYYWRVRAKGTAQLSGWSAVWYFKTVIAPPVSPSLITPLNGASGIAADPLLKWSDAGNNSLYHLQLSGDTLFSVLVFDQVGITSDSMHVGKLSNNKIFYWRVNATNAGGISPWSMIWKFTTIIAIPSVPLLLSPAHGSIDQTGSVQFQWESSDSTALYRIEISASSTFDVNIIDTNTVHAKSLSVGSLLTGSTYYWRVNASNGGGTTSWTSPWGFSTKIVSGQSPPAPLVTAPENGVRDLPSNVKLQWKEGDSTSVYRLQVASDAVFSTAVYDSSGILDRSITLNKISAGQSYYWRLNATNTAGTSPWSMTWWFFTKLDPPGIPVLLSPPSGASSESAAVTVAWVASVGASSYHLQLSQDAGFNIPIVNDSLITASSQVIQSLAFNTTYYWRVNAKNATGLSGWSAARSFTTRTASGLGEGPVLVSPANGSTNQSITPTLQWNDLAGTSSYEIQIAAVPDFSIKIFDNSNITTLSQQVGPLRNDTTFYWRVRGFTQGVPTDWSATWSFRTIPVVPAPPVLQSPLNGSTNQPLMVKLLWSGPTQSAMYQIQVASTISFSSTLIDDSIVGKDTLTAGPFEFNSTYYWRVRARNAAGWSEYSNVWDFTIVGGIASIASTLPPTNVGFNSATLNASVNPNGNTTSVVFQFGTTAAYGSAVDATPSTVHGKNAVVVNVNIQGLAPNITYHYRVVATDSTAVTFGEDQAFTTLLPAYPATYKVRTTVSFPSYSNTGDYKSTDYRLVGLPGAGNTPANLFVRGTQNADWQYYWDNGAPANGMIPFDGSSTFRFTIGKAFWLLYRGQWSLDTTLASAPLDTAQKLNIPLHSGWNLITNPYGSPIHWSSIQANDTITEPIYAFNGTFEVSADFQPYVGYYYFNASNAPFLAIPYALLFNTGQRATLLPQTDWSVRLDLSSGEFTDQSSWIGVSRGSIALNPKSNYHKPRAVSGGAAQIIFNRPEWDSMYSSFASDIRPGFSTLESWPFDVVTPRRESLLLQFTDIAGIPQQFQVRLIDNRHGRIINLREQSLFEFQALEENSPFTLVIGVDSAMQEYMKSIPVPMSVSLGNNYPNPFNPSTTIPVELSSTARIALKVFNVLGQEIRSLFNGTLDAGFYSFVWDGLDGEGKALSNGVYFYRLESSLKNPETKKMLMMK